MANSELTGELRYRDGETKTFTVKTENNLKSLIGGVKKLNSEISEVLTSLVEQEKLITGNSKGASRVEDEEEDESEEDDAEEPVVVQSNSAPPSKRLKT